MGASYDEIARSARIFGNFAGGRKHPKERKSIDKCKSERWIRFQTLKQRIKRQALLCKTSLHEWQNHKSVSMTIAQLCGHFDQCEFCLTNTWRSFSTKNIYKVYLKKSIIPKWTEHLLSDIRTIDVESWLRGRVGSKSDISGK
jgi:hypothetical protein